jgi:hypothetical protein
MTITVSVTKDVTDLSVTDTETSLTINPSTIELGVVNVAFSQASSADAISSDATGHITATTVQGALDEIGADPQFTSTLKNKLDNVQAQANKLTAGTNVNISEGAINADVLGALQAGQNISISETGEISASAVSLTDVYTADDQDEHLGLTPTPNQGDVVIRTDENKTYIHNGGTTSSMADYTELAQSSGVNSVNSYTGVVNLASSDLSDYAANKYIDWTTEQSVNIHSGNIDATTYYAGQNIAISEIEGLQYIQTQRSARLNGTDSINVIIDSLSSDANTIQYKLEVDHDYLLGQDNSGITFDSPYTSVGPYSSKKITIEGVNQDYLTSGGAIIVYSTDVETNESTPIMLLGESTFQLSPSIVTMTLAPSLQMGHQTLGSAQLARRSQDDSTYTIVGELGSRTYNRTVRLHEGCWTETADIGTSDNGLATTKFVADAIALGGGGGGANIPAGSGHEKFVTQDENGVFRNRDLDIINNFTQLGDDVSLRIKNDTVDINAGNSCRINSGQAISLTAAEDGTLTISANPDGLPAQSVSTDGYVLTSDGADANWVDLSIASLPIQTDNSGKFLTTNGTLASWAEVDLLPNQENNDGKFLTTFNGGLSWADVDAFPEQSADTNGKFLSSSGVAGGEPTWALPDSTIPAQDTHTGKYLTTDGSQLSWSTINTAGQTGDITFSQSTITSSGDTVTVDDDLTTTGTLDAQQLDITGAGQPQITSASTFNIAAPEGLYINGNLLTGTDVGRGYLASQTIDIDADFQTGVQDGYHSVNTEITGVGYSYRKDGDDYYMQVQLNSSWTETTDIFIEASFNDKDSSVHTVTSVADHSTEFSDKWRINLIHLRTTSVHNPLGLLKITIYEA